MLQYILEYVGFHIGICWSTYWRMLQYIFEYVGVHIEIYIGVHIGICWSTYWRRNTLVPWGRVAAAASVGRDCASTKQYLENNTSPSSTLYDPPIDLLTNLHPI